MTSAFIAEALRRRTRMTLRIWEHECCGDMYWSAAPRCDRCGEIATTLVTNLSVAEAMAGHPLLPLEPPRALPASAIAAAQQPGTTQPKKVPDAATAAATPPSPVPLPPRKVESGSARTRRDSNDDRRAVSILFWCGVGVSLLLGIYASEEATRGNGNEAIALAVAATSTPLAVLCGLIDGRLLRTVGRLFRRA